MAMGQGSALLRSPSTRPAWRRYGVAVAVSVLAFWVRYSLSPPWPMDRLPFISFFPAVAVAAWYGGLRPGVVSVLLSSLFADVWFFEPIGSLEIDEPLALVVFALSAFVIVSAVAAMHYARDRLLHSERKTAEARDTLATTLASIGDGVVVTDAAGHVTFLNPEAERLTGWSEAQARGRPLAQVFRIVNERTRKEVESPVERVLAEGVVVGLANHTVLLGRGGTETPIDDSAAPVREPGGPVLGVVLVFRDVTAQRLAQAEKERLAAIVESSGDAILSKGLDGTIRTWNAAAERLFGYRANEMVGRPVNTLVPPDLRAQEDEILERLRRGQSSELLETTAVDKGGRRIPVSVRVSPLRDADGEVVGASKTVRDLSDLFAARDALAREKETLATTLASIGDAVLATDAEGRVTFLNPVAEDLTGWPAADACGRPLVEVFRVVHEDTREEVDNPALRAIREGTVVGLANHTVLVARSGEERPIDDSAAPIRDAKGTIVGAVLVFRDVAARRTAEAALKESEQRLRLSLQAGKMGAWEWTIATGKVTWSPELEAIHGLAPGTFPGTFEAYRSDIHPDDALRVAKEIARTLDAGTDHHVEYRIVRPDGAVRWVEGRGKPVRDRTGAKVRMIGVCTDVTERKRAEEALRESEARERAARLEAEQANQAKDDFVATLSHELRTPLNAILGWSRLLSAKPADRKIFEEGVHVIARNAKAQADLIADLLDTSRIVSGKLHLDLADVDLADVVRAAIDAGRASATTKGVEVRAELPGDVGLVRGDAGRLQQVVWNLLSNAVKFTPEGGRVDVVLSRRESDAVLVVRDTGIGIPPEFLPHLFTRFRQADASEARRHGGLGLGLSIVKHLVELHRGSVRAESDGRGRGATFTVTIPLAPAGAAPEGRAAGGPHARAPLSAQADLAGVTVLAIDDQQDSLALVAHVLSQRGARVLTAVSVDAGLLAYDSDRPHVVLCDLGMPGKDGYDFIRALRERGGSAPALAVTAYARTEDERRAVEAGYRGHLAKPFEPSDLVAAVAALAAGATRGDGGGAR